MTKTERGTWMINSLRTEPEAWKFRLYSAVYKSNLEIWTGTSGLAVYNPPGDNGPRIGNWFQKRQIMKLIDDLKWTIVTKGIV